MPAEGLDEVFGVAVEGLGVGIVVGAVAAVGDVGPGYVAVAFDGSVEVAKVIEQDSPARLGDDGSVSIDFIDSFEATDALDATESTTFIGAIVFPKGFAVGGISVVDADCDFEELDGGVVEAIDGDKFFDDFGAGVIEDAVLGAESAPVGVVDGSPLATGSVAVGAEVGGQVVRAPGGIAVDPALFDADESANGVPGKDFEPAEGYGIAEGGITGEAVVLGQEVAVCVETLDESAG